MSPVFCPDAAPMSFDDGARDGQPHAHALALGCEEGLEEMSELIRTNTRTRIRNRDFGESLLILSYSAGDPAVSGRLIGQRINRIHDQVENDLLKLNPVTV